MCVVGALIATAPAEARHSGSPHATSVSSESQETVHTSGSGPPYADIVVDANTGAVLHAASADEPRHPASLTKIMTLYLLFERLEAGKLRLDSQLPVSEHAAVQAPTKLGLRPGQTVAVEDAIRALVTKSANDAAVVVAEAIGGDESEFADMMTRKAHALGMTRTTYRNASGLPNDQQITTARDQALLGRLIQERFPRYYAYFATPSFTYHGETMRNHNHLLGHVEGLDGIKTGYTQASGYNLVTSVHRNNRHIVSVVLGGSSGGARDARMRSLIEQYIVAASSVKTGSVIADAGSEAPAARPASPRAAEGRSAEGHAKANRVAASSPAAVPPSPSRMFASTPASAAETPADAAAASPITALLANPAVLATEPIRPIAVKTVNVRLTRTAGTAAPGMSADQEQYGGAPARSGWVIQIGAFEREREARQKLSAARAKAAQFLGHASPFTETVVKGEKTLYRARFAGLQKDEAEEVCRQLKRNDFECMTVRN